MNGTMQQIVSACVPVLCLLITYGCFAPLLIAVTLAGPAFGLLLELAALALV